MGAVSTITLSKSPDFTDSIASVGAANSSTPGGALSSKFANSSIPYYFALLLSTLRHPSKIYLLANCWKFMTAHLEASSMT